MAAPPGIRSRQVVAPALESGPSEDGRLNSPSQARQRPGRISFLPISDRTRETPVKFGFPLKQRGVDPAEYAGLAAAAETHGFESVWLPEHLVLPSQLPPTYPYSASGYAPIAPETPELDPWVALAAVAAPRSESVLPPGSSSSRSATRSRPPARS